MANATQQKARKDYPEQGIKKGELYWKWSFRFGGIFKSKTRPKSSQLTQSPFLSEYHSILESVETFTADTIEDEVQAMIERVEALGAMSSESLENMPEGLQEGDTQLLQERIDGCESWFSDLENICFDALKEESEDDEGDSTDIADKESNGLPEPNEKKESLYLEIMDEIGNCEPGFA